MYTIYDGYTFGWIQLVIIEKRKGEFIGRERLALRSALERLPFRLSIDYAVLCLASLSPLLILDVQRFFTYNGNDG
mgnify:CR=1 FL=1